MGRARSPPALEAGGWLESGGRLTGPVCGRSGGAEDGRAALGIAADSGCRFSPRESAQNGHPFIAAGAACHSCVDTTLHRHQTRRLAR
jgi:hypothetical protein